MEVTTNYKMVNKKGKQIITVLADAQYVAILYLIPLINFLRKIYAIVATLRIKMASLREIFIRSEIDLSFQC